MDSDLSTGGISSPFRERDEEVSPRKHWRDHSGQVRASLPQCADALTRNIGRSAARSAGMKRRPTNPEHSEPDDENRE